MSHKHKLTTFQAQVVGLLLGLVILAFSGYFAYRSNAAQSWPTMRGTVTESYMKKSKSRRKVGRRYRTRTQYSPVVRYKYRVAGKAYEDSRSSYAGFMNFGYKGIRLRKPHSTVLDKYPKGKSVVVHYNPKKPADSMLETKLGIGFYVMFLIGGCLTAFSAIGLVPDSPAKTADAVMSSDGFPSPAG